MGRQTYKLVCGSSNTFIAMLVRKGREKHIYIGNPLQDKGPCIHLEIPYWDPQTLVLQSLNYHSFCSLSGEMKPGRQGTIPMLQAGIVFAKQKFPKLATLVFQDESGFHVKDPDFHYVNLAERDIFLFGQTWYQRALGPLDIYPQTEKAKALLTKYLKCAEDKEYYQTSRNEYKNDLDYAASDTWKEYFKRKPKRTVYRDWIKPMVRETFMLPSLKGVVWQGDITHADETTFNLPYEIVRVDEFFAAKWGGVSVYPGPLDIPSR